MTFRHPKTGAPAQHQSVGRVITIYPRQVNVVAGSLRGMAGEMKAMAGPWPSPDFQARLELLEVAARYLSPLPVVPATNLRKRSAAQYASKKVRK